MNINSLPDDCLRLIFRNCPLQHYLHLRVVCGRWCSVITQLCHQKRSLKVFTTDGEAREYCNSIVECNLHDNTLLRINRVATHKDDLLICSNLNLITNLFSNLQNLVICFSNFPSNHLQLLSEWTELISVTLFRMPKSIQHQELIWSWLRSMSHLERLYLLHMSNCISFPHNLHFLSQLKHFSISRYHNEDISTIIHQLGPKCTSLSLDNVKLSTNQMQDFKWSTNLAHLRLNFVKFEHSNYSQILHLICTNFPRLTCLDFSFSLSFHLVDLIPYLMELKQLTELRLNMGSTIPLSFDLDVMFELAQLRTVRTLHLVHYAYTNKDNLYFRLIPYVFPHLEVITLRKHHATPWPLLLELCELSDLPLLRQFKECTFENLFTALEGNLA